MHKQAGFGLIELLLGIVVVGLLGWGAFMLYAGDSEKAIEKGQHAEQQAEEAVDANDARNDALKDARDLE